MAEAWVQLLCPACGEDWETDLGALPAPGAQFACDHCGARRPLSEFARTRRDLEVLSDFHES